MAVPYTFGSATTSIPLSQLDSNFATTITLGNTAIQLGNTVTTLNNMTLANVTVSTGNVTITSASLSGNLTFTGTGNRITGDFSNATVASRVMFQTTTTNSQTRVSTIPNGTNLVSGFHAYNNQDPTNAAVIQLETAGSGTEARLSSTISGTGTYLPMTFYTGGSERVRIDTSGNVGIGTASPNKKLEVVSAGEIIRATSSTGANDQNISIKNNSGTADTSTNIFFADRYAASSYASSYIRGTTSGTSALIFATGGTNFTNIYDAGAPTEKARVNTYGIGLGGTVPTSGMGIAFPASQSSSSDANTLDDYEEGTWTPSLTGTATYTTQSGKYTKIGNFVWAAFRLKINAIGNSSAEATIQGLPFAGAGSPINSSGGVSYWNSLAVSPYYLSLQVSNTTTNVFLVGTTAAQANITNGIAIFGSGSEFIAAFGYYTST